MGLHNRRGRPKKEPAYLRDENLLIRLDAAEKTTFKAASDLAGVTLSAWARERLRHAAVRELTEARQPIAIFDDRSPG
jgi:hypothetical protein